MLLKAILSLAFLAASATAAAILESRATKSCFPSDVQAGILNIQNEINTVINDVVQDNTDNVAEDYSSTGRSLSFLVHGLRPKGCPAGPLPPSPTTSNGTIANLQKTQLGLSYVAQDAINGKCKKGKKDICRAFHLYQSAAQYVDSIRTDG